MTTGTSRLKPHLRRFALSRQARRYVTIGSAPGSRAWLAGVALAAGWFGVCAADALPDTVARIKPSIVGIGTYSAVRRPPAMLLGSGFVIGDGRLAATNLHVVAKELDDTYKESLVVFVGRGREAAYRPATVVAQDERHDLALLAFEGEALPPLTLAAATSPREGTAIAFTGFPIGAVLGLYPVTHHGIVSALTPLAVPATDARQLSPGKIAALRDPYEVLQLDATAYPGNSGSPVYLQDTGQVVGIIDQVFVKGRKEDVLRDPSAITYAIPVTHLATLLERHARQP